MSKVTNVRLPNAASAQYNPQQIDQLVRSIEQIVLQLNSNYTPNVSEDKAEALAWFYGK